MDHLDIRWTPPEWGGGGGEWGRMCRSLLGPSVLTEHPKEVRGWLRRKRPNQEGEKEESKLFSDPSPRKLSLSAH